MEQNDSAHTEQKPENLARAQPMHTRLVYCFQFIFMMSLAWVVDGRAWCLIPPRGRALKNIEQNDSDHTEPKPEKLARAQPMHTRLANSVKFIFMMTLTLAVDSKAWCLIPPRGRALKNNGTK